MLSLKKIAPALIAIVLLCAWGMREYHLAPRDGAIIVPFELTPDGFIQLEGKINGKKACFVVDTGARVSIIHSKHTDELGLTTRETDMRARGLGTLSHPVEEIDSFILALGKLHHRCDEFVGMDLQHIESDDTNQVLHGLLGSPFLTQYAATIDYDKQRIAFMPSVPAAADPKP